MSNPAHGIAASRQTRFALSDMDFDEALPWLDDQEPAQNDPEDNDTPPARKRAGLTHPQAPAWDFSLPTLRERKAPGSPGAVDQACCSASRSSRW